MGQQLQFRWHADAKVFARGAEVPRATAVGAQNFCAITDQPSDLASSNLGAAVLAGDAFCISAHSLPESTKCAPPDFLTYTGGSTGTPKIIHRNQASWIASFEVNAGLFDLTSKDTAAVFGALSHSLTLYGVLEALHLGMDAHLLEGLPSSQQRQALADHRITVLYATPTQLKLLLNKAHDPLPDVRLILCGGGVLNDPARAQINTGFPNADLRQFYGAAETSFVTMSDAETPPGSVGRAYPGVEIRIQDGEVFARSPYLFQGYADGQHAAWADGFFSVGEMGELDANGYLTIHGRKDRAVTIADQTVHPEAIEAPIAAGFDGLTCVALPKLDGLRGQQMVLVTEGEQDPALAQRMRETIRSEFGAIATPGEVIFLPSLPMLPSGKVDVPALNARIGGT